MNKGNLEQYVDNKLGEFHIYTVLKRDVQNGEFFKNVLGVLAIGVVTVGLLFLVFILSGHKPYMVTDEVGNCLFIAEPWDTFPNGEPIGIECDMYFESELGAPMTKTEFNERFGNENF